MKVLHKNIRKPFQITQSLKSVSKSSQASHSFFVLSNPKPSSNMQKVALALLLVAVASASALTFNVREKRTFGSVSSPLSGAVGSIPGNSGSGGSSGSGATGTGSGGVAGVGAALNGVNEQTCHAMQGSCSEAACSADNTQINQASGSGALLGLGQGVGNIGAPVNVCPALCLTCVQAGLLTLGK